MNIAELFVNIGLKGKDEVSKGLGAVGNELGAVSSMSLEAKAALLAVIYGFDQMFSKSMNMGASLSNFSTLTGIGTKELQQYRWAMEGAGGSADELQGNLKSLQSQLTNIDFNKGTPEGMAMLQQLTGGMTKEQMQDTLYVFQRLQTLSQNSNLSAQQKNHILDTFGISDGTKAAMRLNAFNEKALRSAQVLSSATLNANRLAKGQWSHFGTEIENAFAVFNGKHGQQIIGDLEKITSAIAKLADKLVVVAEKLKVFQLIGKVFEGWAMIFDGVSGLVDNTTQSIDDIKKDSDGSFMGTLKSMFKHNAFLNGDLDRDRMAQIRMMTGDYSDIVKPIAKNPNKGGNTNINITSHNHGVKDAEQVGSQIGKEVKKVQHTTPSARQVK